MYAEIQGVSAAIRSADICLTAYCPRKQRTTGLPVPMVWKLVSGTEGRTCAIKRCWDTYRPTAQSGECDGKNGENYKMRSFTLCIPHQILRGDKIREDKMGGACGMYGYRQKYKVLVQKNLRERNHIKDLTACRMLLNRVLTHWGRMTQICVFNTRLFSLHNTLNYAVHRACLRMVLLTDVYRNLTSLWINL